MRSFRAKVAAAAGVGVVLDRLAANDVGGSLLAVLPAAALAAVAVTGPALRHYGSRWCLAGAAIMTLLIAVEPGPIAILLYAILLASAALGPMRWSGDVLTWGCRLFLFGLTGSVRTIRDAMRLARVRRSRGGGSATAAVRLLALPVIGTIVFVALFAGANPLVARAVAALALPVPAAWPVRLFAIATGFALVWPALRPGGYDPKLPPLADGRALVSVPVPTLLLSLAVFNALFAVENLLDLAFLWSGARLPAGTNVADYARQGAHLLIVTALLAGGFVIVALHPGTAGAQDRRVRLLVLAWVAQNVMLVASSARRLFTYIATLGLTEWRIATLMWMALVATGLALIGWRLFAGRSAAWLVNAAAAAAGIVLTLGSAVDIGAVAAAWNVRHASRALPVNLCYLSDLGSSALVPLVELEARSTGATRLRVTGLRQRAMAIAAEGRWQDRTWRDAQRLRRARAILGATPDVAVPARLRTACWPGDVERGPLTATVRP